MKLLGDALARGPRRPGGTSFRSRYGFVVAIALTVLLIAQMIPASRSFGARRGFVDISGAPARGLLRLKGEWEFYWGRLLGPGDFEAGRAPSPDAYMWLPGVWTRARLRGGPLPSIGDATYRLRIRHRWKDTELGVKILRVNCAFELYADGKLVASGGSLPGSPGGFLGAYEPQTAFFSPESDDTVLTLRVSNRIPGAWSGPVEELAIGPRKDIESEANGSIIADAFNVSGRLLLAALFVVLSLLFESRLAAVFSATTLVMVLHTATTREMVLLRLFPAMDFSLFIRLQLFSSLALLPFLLFTFEAFLREGREDGKGEAPGRSPGLLGFKPSRPRDWAIAAAATICAGLLLYLGLAGDSVYLKFFQLFIPATLLCFVYYSTLVLHDATKREVGIAQAGIYLLLFFYTAYDILCQLRIVDQAYMYPLFFLKRLPTLGGLATVQLQQGLLSYFTVAALGVYFAYDILSRHFAKLGRRALPLGPAAASGSAAPAERDRLILGDSHEIALIKERVEKAIADPGILGMPDLDIRALAAIVKVPPYRLSLWFNSCLSTTFPAWLNARRIERAQRLLRDHPDRTIIDIAMEAGYASKSVFNEQFRRIVGASPSEWRRSALP